MKKYKSLAARAKTSVDYWAQAAMRRFVTDIDRRMEAKTMSRAELAARLGTSAAYITKALRGDVNFTLESMTKLALAVGGRLHVSVVDRSVSAHWGAVNVQSEGLTRVAQTTKLVLMMPSRMEGANQPVYQRIQQERIAA
jgi:transcriptional regulator with XRE-family HTH domain